VSVADEQRAGDSRPVRFELEQVVADLREVRARWRATQYPRRELRGRELPSRDVLQRVVNDLRGALFPMRLGPPDLRPETEDFYVGHTLDSALDALARQVRLELAHGARRTGSDESDAVPRSEVIVREFSLALPQIRAELDLDVLAAYHGDPAATSVDEVLICYPGVVAMIHHRIAHRLYLLGVPLLARITNELAHALTGIDIHPGASIGPGFFIDHGTGVVIGETAVIGMNVRLYQAVTLGAKRFPSDGRGQLLKGLPRHPIVEDDVVIYAGATILGRVTIGRGSTVGGNVWLTHSVPPGSHITQARTQDDARIENGAAI
jgi:serine O-acetyltransferase